MPFMVILTTLNNIIIRIYGQKRSWVRFNSHQQQQQHESLYSRLFHTSSADHIISQPVGTWKSFDQSKAFTT